MQIGVPKERAAHERRVAATPETVRKLKALGVDVLVEAGAGANCEIADQLFADAGATIVPDEAAVFAADIVLKVKRPDEGEMALLRPGQVLVGQLDPYMNKDQVQAYAERKVAAFALELLPRTTRGQAMDVLSSQANLAGYKAVLDALEHYARVMPMMMTAAGTVTAAKVFVMGAGVAGLQAIATARRLGAVVTATDVRPAAKEEIASLGAKFVGFIPEGAATAGGYARALTPEEQAKQQEVIAEHIKNQDIVITTALIPGRKAPVLVTEAMVASMKPGSVIVDLAVETGGNVAGSVVGEVVEKNGVKIVGNPNVASRLAPAASTLYARNLLNFVTLLVDPETKGLVINREDELIKGTQLTDANGAVVHDAFQAA
ncbi:MAG TPA: Re/Si-specific NAD(P)(+) transhydrogenase subunit alpha [Geminicoccus sp.]|uniref:Re/Si-specific NAD(P)(+) transhydrogenase subunit alpha n=1 Tax=Geminicoccus sp. TaxID=2024832 RepID=UPI002C965B77|nr:Re/Si-specific NAD(P)(+) transhydrogenase subunit alpha [Geminicoccus sp.]HWL69847.1 Re/Si-specific NAD(P)(+) transhydrogenase subunit alpha [Geminicoccus sp.]